MSVHVELSSAIARQLAPKLRPKYIVRTMRRFVTETIEDVTIATSSVYPDVSVAEAKTEYVSEAEEAAPVPPALQVATLMPEKVPVVSVEIRDSADRQLVTAIEVISPTNKRGEGYREYLERRERILLSTAHLLEIDLLRMGKRVPMRQSLPEAPYFVFLSRASARPLTDVWPVQLDEQLPIVPVPLQDPDPDVTLDLQYALRSTYDDLGYDLSVDYSHPPEVPFSEQLAVQSAKILEGDN